MDSETYDNIWDALDFEPEKAKSLNIRSELMIELTKFIQKKKFTQKKAAKFFGVSQPRISNLNQGKIDLFTIDFLVELCVKAGIEVDVSISRKTEEVVEITEELEREVIVEKPREFLSGQTQSETYNNQSNPSNDDVFLYFAPQTDIRKAIRIGE